MTQMFESCNSFSKKLPHSPKELNFTEKDENHGCTESQSNWG
jgi:hypothetical protein